MSGVVNDKEIESLSDRPTAPPPPPPPSSAARIFTEANINTLEHNRKNLLGPQKQL